MPVRFAILGAGPAGNTAATVAASLGAEVTLVERDVIGGAAHLWDCIPSKAMVATGNELTELKHARTMGLDAQGDLDVQALRERIARIECKLCEGTTSLLESQGVRLLRGTGRLTGPNTLAADTDEGTEEIEADAILISTGSRLVSGRRLSEASECAKTLWRRCMRGSTYVADRADHCREVYRIHFPA